MHIPIYILQSFAVLAEDSNIGTECTISEFDADIISEVRIMQEYSFLLCLRLSKTLYAK